MLLLALARRPRLLILDEPTSGLDPVARHELLSEFMDVLRDEDRSILFSSHNTVDVERISDRITFIDRGRLVDSSDKEDFLERWRRIQLQLPAGRHAAGTAARRQPGRRRAVRDAHHQPILRGSARIPRRSRVREVQRMSLEEIFVANVMHHREAARPMNMLTRKLIAKEFYLNRWLIVGLDGRGRRRRC